MTAPSSIDPTRFLYEQLDQASPDLLRQMLATFINTLMSAEADAICGAPYGQPSPDRSNVRNGYRHRTVRMIRVSRSVAPDPFPDRPHVCPQPDPSTDPACSRIEPGGVV